MLFSTPSHFVVLALVAFGFWLVGFAMHPGGRKWKEMYEQEADDFSGYRTDADDKLRAANRRVAELERDNAALERQRGEATAAIADLEARHAARPAVVPVAPEPALVELAPFTRTAVEPAAAEPIAEPVEAEPVIETVEATPVEPEPEPVVEAVEAPLAETPMPIAAPTPTPAFAPEGVAPVPPEAKKAWFGAAGYNDLTLIRGIDGVLSTRLFGLGVTRFSDIEKLSAEDEIALEQRLNVPAGFIAREQWRDQAALLRAGNTAEHNARFGVTANA
jgi:predicted flap endonuclease-1-like 5' DNA nuclease